MIQKVFKYGTGQEIPEGAIYLCTKTETTTIVDVIVHTNSIDDTGRKKITKQNTLVWHYFLVKVEE